MEPTIVLGIAEGRVKILDFDRTRQFNADRVVSVAPIIPADKNLTTELNAQN